MAPEKVFPARAGMSRTQPFEWETNYSVPRASGDEPNSWLNTTWDFLCSPRERG